MHPFEKNLFRTAARLNVSRNVLDSLWIELADHAPTGVLAWREAAALVAAARWSVATAERRNESRGMHRREDFPEPKAQLAIRLLSGGLDRVWVAADGNPERAIKSTGAGVMIELIVSDRCTNCGDCIAVCPTNVLDPGQAGPPILARVRTVRPASCASSIVVRMRSMSHRIATVASP